MHSRVLVDGFEIVKRATIQFLEKFKTPVVMGDESDREFLRMVARTTVRTKLYESLADQLTDIVVNAVLCIRKPEEAIDLLMVEIMHIRHKFDVYTCLFKIMTRDTNTNILSIGQPCWHDNCPSESKEEKHGMIGFGLRRRGCPNDHTITQIKDAFRDGLKGSQEYLRRRICCLVLLQKKKKHECQQKEKLRFNVIPFIINLTPSNQHNPLSITTIKQNKIPLRNHLHKPFLHCRENSRRFVHRCHTTRHRTSPQTQLSVPGSGVQVLPLGQ
ncbi:T-complex protein 1 subunit zeta-like protein [Trifolium pratense]|uniref:T-complex protein 1 subunit zeta-like protein n=1 Tax=Trifolium pratense TaxID=57577 RepID=A0A2K3MWY6_TRIPR|nr:T-complex protein 1 subunit zeta-like protein [Trifolium pratense]